MSNGSSVERAKRRVFELLANDLVGGSFNRAASAFLITLIALNVTAVIVQTVDAVEIRYGLQFRAFEAFSVAVFTVEYLLRLWVCTGDERYADPIRGRVRYATTPMAVADLMAFLPFYIPMLLPFDLRFLRIFRLLRLVRLLKIGRYSESSTVVWRVLHSKRHELLIALYCLVTVMVVASSAMYYVEHEAQPRSFPSIPATMWWALVTLTTVGYGDVYPVTAVGKLLAGVVALLGIAIFALPAGILAAGFTEERSRGRGSPSVCPHCGRAIGASEAGMTLNQT